MQRKNVTCHKMQRVAGFSFVLFWFWFFLGGATKEVSYWNTNLSIYSKEFGQRLSFFLQTYERVSVTDIIYLGVSLILLSQFQTNQRSKKEKIPKETFGKGRQLSK